MQHLSDSEDIFLALIGNYFAQNYCFSKGNLFKLFILKIIDKNKRHI